MGLSLSVLLSAWSEILDLDFFCLWKQNESLIVRSISFRRKDGDMILRTISFKKDNSATMNKPGGGSQEKKNLERSISFKNWEEPAEAKLKTVGSSDNLDFDKENLESLYTKRTAHGQMHKWNLTISPPEPAVSFSPRPISELDAAATKLQKVYKSYRTRRNLADCAVVVEELWWKALDFAALKRSSVSFFNIEKPETAASRWLRARTRAARVGKGLSKDEKAQKLALQHWLEAIDPRHRYGHNLHFYYDTWSESRSTQPFFYWLDVGDGKELNLEACPRTPLQRQCINYLGPKERESFEVIVEDGKLIFRQSGIPLNTTEDTKWIFVLSTSRALYVGQKRKGVFQHSSFLSGGATTAAGRLVAHDGILEAIWPYSGHYLPTEENFKEFISFLEENHVDLTNVKRCAVDDDYPSFKSSSEETKPEMEETLPAAETSTDTAATDAEEPRDDASITTLHQEGGSGTEKANAEVPVFDFSKRLSCKWTSGFGPRIGCVRDYPPELQTLALEQVSLSPRVTAGGLGRCIPIPSPRPSPKIRLSPRLQYMGLPSPRVSVTPC